MHNIEFTKRRRATSHWPTVGISIFLILITWLVFGQTVRHDFINYDDPNYVYQNTNITRGLTVGGTRWAFTHIHAQNWHPLTTISHMADCTLYGLNAGGHHFTNVLLHTAAVLLLFHVIRILTGALWSSAFVAALFAIHPLHVESVAWIAERKDVLSAVFFMLTVAAYTFYARSPSRFRYLAVMLLFALGLMCKPMLVTLPFILLLLDYWPLQRLTVPGRLKQKIAAPALRRLIWRQLILEKIPLLVLSAGSAVLTFLAQRNALGWTEQLPVLSRINNALVSYIIYLWQMLWPVKLSVFYPHPENRLSGWQITLAFVLLITLTATAVALRRRHPYFLVGWLWYLGMLVPVIGIVQVGWQARADRYTYLPQIGLYIAATLGARELVSSWRRHKLVLAAAAIIFIAALAWRGWLQTSYWQNSEVLWKHALAVTPKNDVAENNLGIVLLERGKVDEAIARFQAAVDLRPENGPAQNNLAKALLQKGQVDKAMLHYYKLLQIDPQNSEARNIVGTVFVQQGRLKDAIAQWQETLALDPENGNAKNNLAWVFATCPEASLRNGAEAVKLAEQALRLSGGKNPILFRTLAAAYAETARFQEAIETARRGSDLAVQQGNSSLVDEFHNTTRLYQDQRPLRDLSLIDGAKSR